MRLPGATMIARLRREEHGVSAVEFAIILPVLLILFLGSFDVTRGVDAKTKVTLLSRTISDFITQGRTVTPTDLENIVKASTSVLYPYPVSASLLTVNVESIRPNPNGDGTYVVDWSYSPANATDRPSSFTPPAPSVVRTTVSYVYKLQFAGVLLQELGLSQITLTSSTYMSPRWGSPVEATSF